MLERKPMIHEQVFEKFGIKEDTVLNNRKPLIPISKEHRQIIIKNNIDHTKVRPDSIINKGSNFTLGFKSLKEGDNFMKEFQMNIFREINQFLVSINENPKDYDRSIIIEDSLSGSEKGAVLTLNY